ncbi:MAG TPA: universal stress protein [Rhodanobacteraceae bacterium]|jgi:nucleotide-binding universal stress UspA family protein
MKDILVHVRDFEKRTPALQYGSRLAMQTGASLSGLYAFPSPVYLAPAYEPELMAVLMDNTRELERMALAARDAFLGWVAGDGVKQAEWLVAEGDAADILAQAAARFDFIVLEHPAEEHRDSPSDLPALVLKAGAPCLVMPRAIPPPETIVRVAVAWNGSPEAMRAVHAALPLLEGKSVLLLKGPEREAWQNVFWKTSFDIREYLERHGVNVWPRAIDVDDDEAGAELLKHAMQFEADLLVMGAYGRSRFSEWMLGGATRHVLARAHLPVLLRH